MNLTKLHVMRVCRSRADPVGRRALLSPVAGRVCCALHCAWHGDSSCRWGTLQTGLKLPEEAFLAPFLSAHWTSTGESKGAAWEERTAGEAEAKQLLTWGRSLVMGVRLRSGGEINRVCHRSCCPWTGCRGSRSWADGSERNHGWDLKGLDYLEDLQQQLTVPYGEGRRKWLMLPARKPQLRGPSLFSGVAQEHSFVATT